MATGPTPSRSTAPPPQPASLTTPVHNLRRRTTAAQLRGASWLRRLLRVPQHEEPKALADFVQAAVMLARGGEAWASAHAHELSERLQTGAVTSPAGQGWVDVKLNSFGFARDKAGAVSEIYTTEDDFKAVTLCWNETSTGLTNPIADISCGVI